MRQGSDILGKSIFAYDTGRTLDTVKDLIFDHQSNQVLGFLVAEPGLFKDARILPLSAVKAIGPSGLITADKTALVPAKSLSRVRELLKEDNVLRGTKIITTDGRNLGTLVDIFFDETTGTVEGYEVSGGLFADAYSGRSFVPALHALTIGEDVAFVTPETATLMEEQVGGVMGALQSAGGQIQEATQYTATKLQEATEYTGKQLQAASAAAQKDWEAMTQAASEQYAIARRNAEVSITNAVVSPEEQRAYALGKTTQSAVQDVRDRVVIPAGVVVTELEVAQAQEFSVLDRLYQATGGDIGQDARDRIQTATQTAKEQWQTSVQQAQKDFDGLRHETLASLTNAAVDPAKQRAYVLGKAVDRDIYTLNGTLLIAEGAIVTPSIVAMAESANLLDELYRATGGDIRAELTHRANRVLAGPTVNQALGHRANATVRTPSGRVVVAAGQIVTEPVLERAKAHNQEPALLEAVGLSVDAALRQGASQSFSKTGERLKSNSAIAGKQLQSEAASLWAAVRRHSLRLKAQAERLIENRRIQGALGRPVTRVILDEQDQVILNVGDLITHKAIHRAREAGCLEILLSSVYNYTPQITGSDLRANVTGDSALVRQNGESALVRQSGGAVLVRQN